MSLYVKKYNNMGLDSDVKFCSLLLKRLDKILFDVRLAIYKDYPNISQGKLIKEIPNILNKDNFKIKDLELNQQDLFGMIFEFKFKIKANNRIFDGFLRRNNYELSKIYGNFELDIFGNTEISNFGDLILNGNKNLKDAIEFWIAKDARELQIPIQEAYIAPSIGNPEIDVSKRIWMYYSNPVDFLRDIIKFIKNLEEIEAPKYIKEEYEKINDKLKPYNDMFIARELYASEAFKPRFEEFVKENNISVMPGSLILFSNNLDNNFIFARELSEKLIFPVMKSVPGREEFIEIIKEKIK